MQGAGTETPLAGQTVTVEAAVTQLTPGLSGFFVQEEPADDDGDPATSEGVFVFRGGVDVSAVEVGDLVQVTGTASERFEQTQLAATDVVVCELVDVAATVDVPPTPLDLPADDAERESREGMLVTTGDTLLTVTDLFGPFRFGEIGLSASGLLRQPTDVLAPDDPQAAALAQANAESFLVVDDRGELGRQAAPWLDGDPRVRAGDTVDGPVVGSLAFSFGEYKVEPLEFFETTPAGSRPAEPDLGGGDRVAFFNVLNLFNGDGQGGGFPTSRGAGTPEELAAQRDGVVQAVDGLGAAVVGIIEVENDYGDGADSSIAQLVGALDAADDGVVDGSWAYVDPGTDTLGTDAIAVGLLYRPALATPVGEPATVDIDDGIDAPKNRWPLAQTFDLGGATRTVVVNHLKSKGSSCEDVATLPGVPADVAFDGDPDSDLEASCVRTRTYALDRVLRWLATDPVAASDATVLGGDLNSYAQETPLEVLEDAGWTDLVATLGEDATSYAFDGRFGRLDHAFASPGSATAFADAAVWADQLPGADGRPLRRAGHPGRPRLLRPRPRAGLAARLSRRWPSDPCGPPARTRRRPRPSTTSRRPTSTPRRSPACCGAGSSTGSTRPPTGRPGPSPAGRRRRSSPARCGRPASTCRSGTTRSPTTRGSTRPTWTRWPRRAWCRA